MICCLKVIIEDREINIYIDSKLYNNERLEINNLLPQFSLCYGNIFNQDTSILIYDAYGQENTFIDCFEFKYICPVNFNQRFWEMELQRMLEEHFANILECTVLHGSCVCLNGKGVLILGKRKSGKSTLTKLLLDKRNADYLDEDSIFIYKNKIYGFNSPIFLRHKNMDGDSPIKCFVDFDGEKRYIYNVKNCKLSQQQIDLIIFPCFTNHESNIIKQITGEKYAALIENVKYSGSIKNVFLDISKNFRQTYCYYISYNDSDTALKIIDKLIDSIPE